MKSVEARPARSSRPLGWRTCWDSIMPCDRKLATAPRRRLCCTLMRKCPAEAGRTIHILWPQPFVHDRLCANLIPSKEEGHARSCRIRRRRFGTLARILREGARADRHHLDQNGDTGADGGGRYRARLRLERQALLLDRGQ